MSRRSSAISAAIAALLLSTGFAARAKSPEEHREQRGERRDRRRQQQPDRAEARQQRAEQRRERRKQRVEALRARFGAALKHPAIRAELELHARRRAKLNALRAVAEREGKQGLLPRIDALAQKEQTRHARRMAALAAEPGSGR